MFKITNDEALNLLVDRVERMYTVEFRVYDNLRNTHYYGFISENGKPVINSGRGSKGWKTLRGAQKAANKLKSTDRYTFVDVKVKN